MKKILFCFAFLAVSLSLFSQKENLEINFQATLERQPIELGSTYEYENSEITFEVLKFYIGKIQFFKNGEPITEVFDSFRLIDFSDSLHRNVVMKIPNNLDFDRIKIQLGVDSLTHETGVMGGDLDPINGMYWAWNTGYINFKLEGKSPLCENRHGSFQYHLGGYLPPFQTAQTVSLEVEQSEVINIQINLATFLKEVDLKNEHTFMSPGAKAKELSKIASKMFTIKSL